MVSQYDGTESELMALYGTSLTQYGISNNDYRILNNLLALCKNRDELAIMINIVQTSYIVPINHRIERSFIEEPGKESWDDYDSQLEITITENIVKKYLELSFETQIKTSVYLEKIRAYERKHFGWETFKWLGYLTNQVKMYSVKKWCEENTDAIEDSWQKLLANK